MLPEDMEIIDDEEEEEEEQWAMRVDKKDIVMTNDAVVNFWFYCNKLDLFSVNLTLKKRIYYSLLIND